MKEKKQTVVSLNKHGNGSPQRANESVDISLSIKRHCVPNM